MLPTTEISLHQTETWKSVPTAKADLRKRGLDGSVCGWLGGQPDLPALCAGASSCVRDTEHKYVGCCGTLGSCTAGFYTSCVDEGSPGWSPPPSIQTNGVYTCPKNQECYRNTFAEDYYQFGCGKSSWATRVESTYSGQPPDVTLQLVYTSITFPGMITSSPIPITSEPPVISMSTETPSPSSNPSSSGKTDPGAVAGIVIGVVNVFVILVGLILCLILRKRRQRLQQNTGSPRSPTHESSVRNVNPMHRLSAMSNLPKILPTPLRINPSLASYRSPHIARPNLKNSPTSSNFNNQNVPLVSSNPERDRFIGSISEDVSDLSTMLRPSEWQLNPGLPISRNLKAQNHQISHMHDNGDIDDDDTLEYHSISGNLTESPRSRESRTEQDITSSVSLMSDQDDMLATASIRHMTHIRRGVSGGYHLVDQVINDDGISDLRNQSNQR
ncbi:hypothetical protein OnM2_027070 [Erysiphe neolycopersici]|uniref:Uncharacterized protein n=1 Tax=Erysiphe neolycopersici TaxID=212602 RepID=A0A420I0K0_9PEZI|nr:hypothetical protein OnM2_027070 [Erysiphe neolycopersici]